MEFYSADIEILMSGWNTLYIPLHSCMMKFRDHFVQSFMISTCLEDVCFCMSYLISSVFLLNSLVLSCFILSVLALSCPALSYALLPCLVVPVLACAVPSGPILSCLALSPYVLFCLIMSYHGISYHSRSQQII
jgi:hypothetical protein